MKRKINTYRILALTMALLMLFSSIGFSIDVHYCQGKIKSFSLIGKAKSCYQLVDASSQKNCVSDHKKLKPKEDNSYSFEKQACCDQKFWQFQLDQDQQTNLASEWNVQELQQFLLAYIAVFYPTDFFKTDISNFTKYRPPLISKDLPVLLESFLL